MPDMDAMGVEDVCGAMDSPTPENERMTSWKIHQHLKMYFLLENGRFSSQSCQFSGV